MLFVINRLVFAVCCLMFVCVLFAGLLRGACWLLCDVCGSLLCFVCCLRFVVCCLLVCCALLVVCCLVFVVVCCCVVWWL